MPASHSSHRPLCVAVAVVEHEGRILIGRRPPHVPLGNLWEFPGGKIRPTESPRAAAERECLEETGLRVKCYGSHGHVEHTYAQDAFGADAENPTVVRISFQACRLLDEECQPRSPFLWVSTEDLANYDFPAANTAIVRELSKPRRPSED